jgi:hypothetical protein
MCTYLLFARPEYFQISVVQLFYGKELAESWILLNEIDRKFCSNKVYIKTSLSDNQLNTKPFLLRLSLGMNSNNKFSFFPLISILL